MRPVSRANVKLDKLPEKSLSQSRATAVKTDIDQDFPRLKTDKLTKEEIVFIKEYRRLEELEREKGIKFFQCIGDPPITSDKIA